MIHPSISPRLLAHSLSPHLRSLRSLRRTWTRNRRLSSSRVFHGNRRRWSTSSLHIFQSLMKLISYNPLASCVPQQKTDVMRRCDCTTRPSKQSCRGCDCVDLNVRLRSKARDSTSPSSVGSLTPREGRRAVEVWGPRARRHQHHEV